MRRHAHSLKGACGYIHSEILKQTALDLQLACEEINNGETTDRTKVEQRLGKVKEQLGQVIEAMKAKVGQS